MSGMGRDEWVGGEKNLAIWMDGRGMASGQVNVWMNGWMDGWMDKRIERQMDRGG